MRFKRTRKIAESRGAYGAFHTAPRPLSPRLPLSETAQLHARIRKLERELEQARADYHRVRQTNLEQAAQLQQLRGNEGYVSGNGRNVTHLEALLSGEREEHRETLDMLRSAQTANVALRQELTQLQHKLARMSRPPSMNTGPRPATLAKLKEAEAEIERLQQQLAPERLRELSAAAWNDHLRFVFEQTASSRDDYIARLEAAYQKEIRTMLRRLYQLGMNYQVRFITLHDHPYLPQ